MKSLLYGREVLRQEVPSEYHILLGEERVQKRSGFIEKEAKWYCRRCHHLIEKTLPHYCQCGKECAYCENCIQMGKVKRCSTFFSFPEPNRFEVVEPVSEWKGVLSKQQALAARDIVHTIEKRETRLLWAVTGAGKTEMLFEGIAYAIRENKRICLTSPRIDVCLELAPRIREAFPNVSFAVLYGEMEEAYRYTQLVLATTHQLYRFKEAFDVMIIDELDAFPFYMDKGLQFAAEKARKQESSLLYLTATPGRAFQKKIQKKQLQTTILPARYHGHPLPVPKAKWCKRWRTRLLKNPSELLPFRHMRKLLDKKQQFLVFIPTIEWMKKFEEKLREYFPTASFTSVYSNDLDRKEKVQKLRKRELDFLLTTTILERGVTFPGIEVIVIGADDRVFTESALVQISGRVGRSKESPNGNVTFYHEGKTKEMKRAIQQIKQMNKWAKERELLHK